ncbi:hypothetical protein KIN20_020185 [Parelaphostrongylus tenuis]|uniref:W02B3.4-like N-terminal domain-containing protein n=1 Tax=Parelaphostrongylus tenuis TaxID=148309 RepID=A0AAD5QT23_PARTN|nr:hypothetical protein KIN20_020185 [Parelaphostrongylus tenuis]
MDCSDVLESINLLFPAFLIDKRIIGGLNRNRCKATFTKIRIGVNMELLASVDRESHANFDIVYYENFTDKDYLLFYDSPTRIIPRMHVWKYGNLSIPQDTKRFFEYWKRSRLLRCRGMKVERKSEPRFLPLKNTLQTMSAFVSYLTSFNIYPLLSGGSLLEPQFIKEISLFRKARQYHCLACGTAIGA